MISRGAALFCEMGVGKTKIVIDTMEIMYYYGKIENALIIAPLSLLDVWKRELEIHAQHSIGWTITGTKKQRQEKLMLKKSGCLNWYIINVDAIAMLEKELSYKKIDALVVDESTIIKNRTAQRTKKTIQLFSNIPYKVIMSGNPIPKSPDEIFAQYALIDAGIFGTRYYDFREKYFDVDYFNKILGFKDKDEFDKRLHAISFRKTKQECLSLPPKIYLQEEIEMESDQKQVYAEMKKDALACYENTTCAAPVVITKMLRLSQIAGGFFPGENGETIKPFSKNPKMDRLLEIIEELPKSEQIVIWARFQNEIQQIKSSLGKIGHTCVAFYGAIDHKDREEARRLFREKHVRIFIGNPATGGRGLNDLIAATTVIYYSNDFSAENRMQSEDRNHRHGTIKVTYIDLIMKATIDRIVLQVLKNNRDFSEALLNHRLEIKDL